MEKIAIMPNPNNLIRPPSYTSTSSTIKLDDTNKTSRKTSIVILTLISTVIFLFVLLLILVCALVVVGKGLSNNTVDKNNQYESLLDSRINNNNQLSNLLLINQASGSNNHIKNTSDKNKNTKIMNIGHVTSKVIEKLSFRLPREIKPIVYNLFLHPNLDKKSFQGNVKIEFNVTDSISFVALHAHKLNVTTNKLVRTLDNGAEAIPIKNSFEYEKFEYWIVEPESPLTAGEYMIDLNFTGSLQDKIVGFYGSSYFDPIKNESRYIATSKFEPTFARQSFPCFDEPAMKAKFKISLIRPDLPGYTSLSNMPVEGDEVPYTPGLIQTNFMESVPMSTYLTVFIVSDFVSIQETFTPSVGGELTVRAFATPAQTEKLRYALKTAVAVIKYYITYFNIEFPLPKLDMAAIPDFVSGAMETWGLVTYRETALLYDVNVSSTANKQRVNGVIAHEFAHMWFGNLVTMKWWSDLWLNEGFASYIEFKGMDASEPTWEMENQFTVDTMHSIMNLDATLGSHPIVVGVETPNQITEIFDGITYNKGASIIRMMEDFIGPAGFQLGVSQYLKANSFKNADTNDLLMHLEDKIPEEVTAILNTWTRQKGLPVVIVEKVEGTNQYKLTQERFLIDPESAAKETMVSEYNYKWYIPLTYITNNSSEVKREWFRNDMSEVLINVDSETKWLKINKNQVGYYRVRYQPSMWVALNDALETDIESMSVLDRAHLLNDVFSLAEAQQVSYDIALEMTKYLKKETHFVPWDVVSNKLKSIRSLLYYTELYPLFKNYAMKLVNEAYLSIGEWDVKPEEHLKNLFRNEILDLACSMDHPECMKKVGTMFTSWISNATTRNTIRPSPDLRSLVYYHGMRSVGTEVEWNIMFEMFEKEQDAQEKIKMQSALSAIKEPWILRKYIDLASADEKYIRKQDYFGCLGSISGNRIGESLVWDYVRDHWSVISSRFGLSERTLGRLIPTITSRFTTKSRLREIQTFFTDFPDAGAGANARIQAVETVENNIKWLERNQQPIGEWLKKQK